MRAGASKQVAFPELLTHLGGSLGFPPLTGCGIPGGRRMAAIPGDGSCPALLAVMVVRTDIPRL